MGVAMRYRMVWRGRPTQVVAASFVVLLAGVLAGVPLTPPVATQQLSAQPDESIKGFPVKALPRPADLSQGAGARRPDVVWPAGQATVDVPGDGRRARAGGLPVWLAATGVDRHTGVGEGNRVRVRTLDRRADSVVLEVAAE